MKAIILVFVLFTIILAQESNPCFDSLYLAFKSRHLDSLTDREYEYFKTKDKACNDINTQAKPAESKENVVIFKESENSADSELKREQAKAIRAERAYNTGKNIGTIIAFVVLIFMGIALTIIDA